MKQDFKGIEATQDPNIFAKVAHGEFCKIFKQRELTKPLTLDNALYQSFILYNNMCKGTKIGRYVLPMPTGTGKTTSIIAWCKTIYAHQLDYSVCIASSKVEELFKIRDDLIKAGVDLDQIGVLYSDTSADLKKFKDKSASVESPESYRFLLVSHQRLQMDKQEHDYKNYKSVPRSLTFWDEEFIKTESSCFGIEKLQGEIGKFFNTCDKFSPDVLSQQDIDLMRKFLSKVNDKLDEYYDDESVNILNINPDFIAHNNVKLNEIVDVYNNKKKLNDDVHRFLKGAIAQENLFPFRDSVMSYREVIDDDIKNIVVLDASYPISPFYELDTELTHIPFIPIKPYKNLKITHSHMNSGWFSVKGILGNSESRADLLDAIVKKINEIPNEEALLIFVFKLRHGEDLESVIRQGLKSRDIDLDKTIPWQDEQRPKYNILTWGQEKATNDYIHCQHFINIGLLDIGTNNLIAQAMAQGGISCINTPIIPEYSELRDRAYAQRLYQAISRTAIRLPGDDLKCTATILTNTKGYIKYLEEVFRGVEVLKDTPILNTEITNTEKWFNTMIEVLEELPLTENTMTITKLNKKVSVRLEGNVNNSPFVKQEASKRLRTALEEQSILWKFIKKGTLERVSWDW